jgi:DNA polymerase-3 subunit gamma/tau
VVEPAVARETPVPRVARQPVKSSSPRPVKVAPIEVPEPPDNAPAQVLDQVDVSPESAVAANDSLYKHLAESWKQIVANVKQKNANTAGLLNSIKTRDLRGNVLTLGFASDVLKSQMEKPANIEIFQSVLQQALGCDIVIRCVTAAGKRNAPPPDVDHDGMVASALRDLGGEIVDIS